MTIKVVDVFNLRSVEGDVGIEVEVEGRSLPEAVEGWVVVPDGSLIGGQEYVSRGPQPLGNVAKHLGDLTNSFKDHHSKIRGSVRAGVHVHFNVQQHDIVQLGNVLTAYFIFEELLTRFCSERRRGNLFALRMSDAYGLLKVMTDAFANQDFHSLGTDDIRYSALNLTALPKFGSLEFRALETDTYDEARILEWVMLLNNVIQFGFARFDNPRDILRVFSEGGQEAFAVTVFGRELANRHILSHPDYRESMVRSCRDIQDFAFSVNWDALRVMEERPKKPFTKLDMDGVRFDAVRDPWVRAAQPMPMPMPLDDGVDERYEDEDDDN